MYVLGTAGHVDHGKSALVQALTGIDPDRLTEEKERGMTIDLGFAWLKLPSGREVSVVDVPGHERFVKNMLAGVGGIDLALLIIAADEGVMPQTREHIAILDLLKVTKGIVVITKRDLVDEEMLDLVTMDAEEAITGTTMASSPIVITSAVSGEGLPDLLSAIDTLLDATTPKRDIGKPRLSVDRVFTMKGFGTVVTGTLIDGKFSVGQEVEVLPSGQRTHIRGLQTHKQKIEAAMPGNRVAVNLAGIATEELQRGFVVTPPGWLKLSRFVDVKLQAISDLPHPIGHNKSITFHTGAIEIAGKIRLLDHEKLNSGESCWAQIQMAHSIPVVKGDSFIIRATGRTLGGGTVAAIHARRHSRFQSSVIESLEARIQGSPEDIILATLEANEPAEFGSVLSFSGLPQEEAIKALETLISDNRVVMLGPVGLRAFLFSASGWNSLVTKSRKAAQNYHDQYPLRTGMPKEELRSRLGIPSQYFTNILQRLTEENILVEEGSLIRLSSYEIKLSVKQQSEVDAFLASLEKQPFSPPTEPLPSAELLNMLIDTKQLVKISENIFFVPSIYDEIIKRIIEHLKREGKITVAEVRDLFKTSRKYALAVMEHLDEQKITRRVGDDRVLR